MLKKSCMMVVDMSESDKVLTPSPEEELPTNPAPNNNRIHPQTGFSIDSYQLVPTVEDLKKNDLLTRRVFLGITAAVTLTAGAATVGISRWDKIKDYIDGKATLSEVFKINW